MGNNPFAGCPKLVLRNESPYFVLENGVLYDKYKTDLIHYTISKSDKEFAVPGSVICLGKHCFFACDNLEKIIIPESVIRMENNPFSGCTKLSVENHSPYYHFEDGVIYNKYKTTVIGCLNGTKIDRLVIPESVTLISRNSFWNCKGIKKIVITENVNRIGYNPFAGCEKLLLESESSMFPCEDGGGDGAAAKVQATCSERDRWVEKKTQCGDRDTCRGCLMDCLFFGDNEIG